MYKSKFSFKTPYTYDPDASPGETNDLPSVTEPDCTMSIRELMDYAIRSGQVLDLSASFDGVDPLDDRSDHFESAPDLDLEPADLWERSEALKSTLRERAKTKKKTSPPEPRITDDSTDREASEASLPPSDPPT